MRVIFKHQRRTDILEQKKWQIIPFSVCIAVLLSLLIPFQVSASLPVGFQEYYVLGYEEHIWQAFIEIDDNDPPVLPGRICSTVNLVATANYQIVYYDHWEDGYEADLLNPIQTTTEVYGDGNLNNGGSEDDILAAGDAINLTSDQNTTTITGYVPVAGGRDPNDLRYDGGDRIISSGGPINLTHAMWPLNNSWVGGAWEVYSRQAYADAYSYRLPVGEDLYDSNDGDTGPYGNFRNVYLQLGAFEDNTTVSISNDTGTVNLTLDRGQTYFSMGFINSIQVPATAITINAGTVVRTNKPSQVGLVTGADGSFQGRFLNILPHRQWGADYVVPIPRGHGRDDDASQPDASAEVYLFNPNDFPIEIHGYDTTTQTSFIVSPTTYTSATVAYSQIRGNSYIPQDSAARFTSADGVFGVVICADTSRIDYDWGFSGTPSKYLTQDYYVSWAPGDYNTPPENNGSPVWVTPMANSTTFYVDFYENASGLDDIADEIFTLDVLQQQRIFDPDNDNTGMHIWATDPFAVAWGEDPRSAGISDPYLDLGVAMLPLQQRWLDPVLTLDKTASPSILSSTSDTVTFTLVAQSYNTPLTDVVLSDTLPTRWTYVSSSTHIIYPDKSTGTPEPTIHGQTLFWDISTDMGFNQSLTLTFQASISETGSVNVSVYDGFESGDYAGGVNWTSPWQEWGDDGDYTSGTIHVTQPPPTIAGSYHLRIQGNDAVTGSYAISRSVNLSDFAMPVLHFMRQVRSLESGDYFYLDTYDGVGWTTALTWTNGSQEFTTIGEAVALTSTTSAIRFRSGDIFDADTALLIDQIKIREGLAISVNQGEAVGKDEYSNTLFNPTDEATVHISPLNLSKSVNSAEAGIGDTLVYTLTVVNLGSTDASNVVIHDAVPTQYVTVQSVSNGATIYDGGGGIVALVDTLAAGNSDTVTFTVTVNDFVENGTLIENKAYVESDQTVKAGSNVVGTTVLAPDIEFTKLGPTVAYPGNELTYTISYKNVGGAPATGVTIRDTIPLSTTYIPGSLFIGLTPSAISDTQWIKLTDDNDADQGTYLSPTLIITPGITPGIVAPGEAGQIRFGVFLDGDVPLGALIQNWATLDRHLSNPSDTNLVIARVSDLLIHKKAEPTIVLPGDTITYTVVYTNVSTEYNQREVYVRASIPDYTHLLTVTESADHSVEYSWDNGATWSTTRPVTPVTHIRWHAAEVPTDTQVTLGFTVQVAPTLPPNTTIESTAYITSENTAAYLSAWIPSNQVQVATVDLWVEKSVSQQTAGIGDPISYTISYGNRGSADVSVQLRDVIPEGTSYITNSIWGDGAYTYETPTLLWNVGTFAASSGPREVGYAAIPESDLLPGTAITNVAVLSSAYGLRTSNPVTVTIVHCANLTVTKSSDPNVVGAGEMLTYTIIISNTGLGCAPGVLVSDTLPANTQFVPGSITLDPPSAGTVGTAPPILASNTTIPAGQHITVTFAVTVAAPLANDTVITNTVAVTSTYTPTPITGLVTTTIHNPALALTKQAGSNWIGAPLTYTITVTNTGYGAVTHAVVTDTLPDGANYISGGSFISNTGTVSWTIATIPANDSQQVTFIVSTCRPSLLNTAYRVITSAQMVTSPLGPPLLTPLAPPSVNADFTYTMNSVLYFTSTSTTNGGPITDWAWDWGDGNTANGPTASHTYSSPGDYIVTLTVTDTCGYTDTTTKTVPISPPELIVTKSAEPPTVIANETLTYTITVFNTGQGPATGVLVSDTLPANTSLVAATSPYTGPVNGVITWSLGALGIDDTRSVTMVVHVDGSVPDGTIIRNTAWVSSEQGISANDTITTLVATIADLRVTKSDSPDPVETGTTLTYTLTVTNAGPSDAQDVYITDTLPLDVTYGGVLDAPPGLWGPTVTPPYLTWYTPTLAADATVTIVFTVTVNADADDVLTNRVVVTSATADPTPGNNSDEETTNTTTTPQANFSSAAYTVGESDGTATITVTLSCPSESLVTVDYATLGGTATPGDDYTATSGTLDFAPLATTRTFTVSITPDLIDEPNETVGLTLTGATSATVGNPATLTILDDDGPAIIAGTVFSDSNGNGVRDAGEVGIPNVLITLEATSPATITTTTTNSSGDYTFTVTITGTYTVIETDPQVTIVQLAALLEPIYYYSTTPNEVHVDVIQLGDTYQVDFGDALPTSGFAAIHGTAFQDIDGDGTQDAVELGIPNVTITLNGSTLNTTDLYGNYTFAVTATGMHTVTAAEPDGYFHTTPEEVHVNVTRMGTAYLVNFGNAPVTSNFASIYGTVFKDIDGNGLQDAIDRGISNVLITLDGDTIAVTGLYGGYTLSTTIAGTHTVSETDPAGYTSTTPNTVTQSVTLNNGYRVDFGDKETCSDDPYEEDDTIEQASLKDRFIVGPVSQGHQFCDDTVDWVRFAANAYTVYTITTNSWGQWADTALALFATGAPTQPLAENSDCDWAPEDYGEGSSCIVWEALTNGDYYVRTTNENGLTGRDTLYNLWIQDGNSFIIYLPIVTRNF